MKRVIKLSTSFLGIVMLTFMSLNIQATKWVKTGSSVLIGNMIHYLYRCERRFLSTDGCTPGEYKWVSKPFPPPNEITAPSENLTSGE